MSNGKPPKNEPVLKPCQVAKLLGVSESTVSRWVRQGLLVAIWLPSGRPVIRESDVRFPGA